MFHINLGCMCLDVVWCCLFVQVVRDSHRSPALLFRDMMHTYASGCNHWRAHCPLCSVLKPMDPMAFDPESDTLREEEATAGQGSCMTVVDWVEADVGKSQVREDVMWKYDEIYTDELVEILTKGRGTGGP